MHRFKLLPISIFTLALAACTSTGEVQKNLNDSWIGKNTDQFFIQFGTPNNSIQLNNGDKLFTWANSDSISLPSHTTTNVMPAPNGGVTVYSSTHGGSEIALECGVQLLARSNGTIKSVKITRDSIGVWQISRCNEVFGAKNG